ncbi:hypothetical protein [Microbispora sp. NBC_01389]|uniref:hypothetical protein n=1 Tax=Microbispora sp. NBC_01389 TaxID=2903584 RepID=UPI003246234A
MNVSRDSRHGPEDGDAGMAGDPRVRAVRWSLYSLATGVLVSNLVSLPYGVVALLAALLLGWVTLRFPDVLRRTGSFHRALMLTTGMAGAGATCLRMLGVASALPPMAGAMALALLKLLQFLGFVWLASVVAAQMRERRWSALTVVLGWISVVVGAFGFCLDNFPDFGILDPPVFTFGRLNALASILWAVRSAHELAPGGTKGGRSARHTTPDM